MNRNEQSVQPEPAAARFLKSVLVGGGPVNRNVVPQNIPNVRTPMSRITACVSVAFVSGCIAATTVAGCSQAADRTLTIYQFQSAKTYGGPFKLDISGLPADAIESTVDTGGPGDPVKRVTLNMDYEFEIAVRLIDDESVVP